MEILLECCPNADMVFHPECIDMWLSDHVTCPVCRTNLIPNADANVVQLQPSEMNRVEVTNNNNDVVLSIDEPSERGCQQLD